MRTARSNFPAIAFLVLASLMAPRQGATTSYWFPWQDLRRVGPVNAIHDTWAESNAHALAGIVSLGYHAVKVWPTVNYLSNDLAPAFTNPAIDVIALRPLQNASLEVGCDGNTYYRWENIDYGQVARDPYAAYGNQHKLIILTGWEADHQINGLACGGVPSQAQIDAFVAMLDGRQAGVESARAANPSAALRVVHAVEVNKVGTGPGFSVLSTIIPQLGNPPDLISYSAAGATASTIQSKLGIILARSGLTIKQIFIGEFSRDYRSPSTPSGIYSFGEKAFQWGVPFIFYWEYRDDYPGTYDELIQGTWPNIVPTANNTGLTNLRNAYDNFSTQSLP